MGELAVDAFMVWLSGEGVQATDAHREMATKLLKGATVDALPLPKDIEKVVSDAEAAGGALDELVWMRKTGDLIIRFQRSRESRGSVATRAAVADVPPGEQRGGGSTQAARQRISPVILVAAALTGCLALYVAIDVSAKEVRIRSAPGPIVFKPSTTWVSGSAVYVILDPQSFATMNDIIVKKGVGNLAAGDLKPVPRVVPWRDGETTTPSALVYRRRDDVPAGVPFLAMSPRRLLGIVIEGHGLEGVVIDNHLSLRRSEAAELLQKARTVEEPPLALLVNTPEPVAEADGGKAAVSPSGTTAAPSSAPSASAPGTSMLGGKPPAPTPPGTATSATDRTLTTAPH